MAITLATGPQILALSRNPIEFELVTDNRILVAGTKALLKISVTGACTDGESFTLAWQDNSETFTFRNAPDNSGNELLATAAPDSAWFNIVVNQLKENFALYRDFNISWDVIPSGPPFFGIPVFVLEAKEAGTDYSLTITESMTFIASHSNTAGVNKSVRPNFKIFFQVYVYNGSAPELIYETYQDPNDQEACTFNIQEVLDAYVDYDFPSLSLAAIQKCSNVSRKYFVRYAESLDGDIQKVTSTSDYYVLLGGLTKQDFADNDFYLDHLLVNKNFLTWHDTQKIVQKEQKEYLYFFQYDAFTSLNLRVMFTYTDNTTGTFTVLTLGVATQYDTIRMPAGYDQLSLDSFATKEVKKYKVWLTNSAGTTVSEEREYIIETECRMDERYFIFGNSQGGVDTLRTYGDHVSSIDIDYELSEKILPSGYALEDGEIVKTAIAYGDKFEVSTGYLISREYKEYLKELLITGNVFEITDGKLMPVVIETKKDELFKQSDNLYRLRFEYNYGYINNSYSKL